MRRKQDLRGYQDRVVTHFYENNGVQAVIPMGGGKTVAALTAVRELIDDQVISHALVLAPKRVAQLVWPKEVHEWEHLENTTIKVAAGPEAARLAALEQLADIHVVGVDNTQWLVEWLKKLPEGHHMFDCLIIDELSRFKAPRGKRGRALAKVIERFKIVWGLTGTPRPNGYEDQYRPIKLISRNSIWPESFDKWRDERMFATDYHRTKWSIRPDWRDRTIADISSVSITIDEEHMPELPELTHVIDYVDLPPRVMREYRRMEREAFARFEAREIGAVNMAVATGKLAQMAQGFMYDQDNKDVEHVHAIKADWLVDKVDAMGGTPLLIAYEFQEDLRVIKEMFPGIPWLGQGTTDKQAEKNEREWNQGKLPLLALHPASAGHGLNLQDGGSQLALYGMTWSAELYDQLIKRFHRSGQTRRSFVHHCIARGTVDEMKHMRVHDKMTMQQAFTAYIRRV